MELNLKTQPNKLISLFKKKYLAITILLLLTSITIQAKGLKILYIGDSITDGNWGGGGGKPSSERNTSDMNHIYGHGFMYICAAHYMGKYPEKEYEFFNRGISGNTLDDLEKRWEKDVIDINPDILSILIGINDVNIYLRKKDRGTFDFNAWEEKYRKLINEVKSNNPNIKIILASPFVVPTGKMKENKDFDKCSKMIDRCISIVEKIARDYHAIYLPYQSMFNELLNTTPTTQSRYWIWDGVHPTAAGHQRMAEVWIEQANKYKLLFP